MAMKVTPLRTYWETDDAYAVIAFLDELRDLLWESYGDQIIEMQQQATMHAHQNDDQLEFDFGDQILF